MSELIVVKKDDLVKAFQKWNIDVIKNPNEHETPNDTLEDAKEQVDAMMSYVESKAKSVSDMDIRKTFDNGNEIISMFLTKDIESPKIGGYEMITTSRHNVQGVDMIKYEYLKQNGEEKVKSVLQRPVNHDLVDIFKELKFGRPEENQKYLQKCIDGLDN